MDKHTKDVMETGASRATQVLRFRIIFLVVRNEGVGNETEVTLGLTCLLRGDRDVRSLMFSVLGTEQKLKPLY